MEPHGTWNGIIKNIKNSSSVKMHEERGFKIETSRRNWKIDHKLDPIIGERSINIKYTNKTWISEV